MTLPDFKNESVLAQFENFLKDKSYVNGYVCLRTRSAAWDLLDERLLWSVFPSPAA